eukprot:767123-Hanusia_phi.AAC.2
MPGAGRPLVKPKFKPSQRSRSESPGHDSETSQPRGPRTSEALGSGPSSHCGRADRESPPWTLGRPNEASRFDQDYREVESINLTKTAVLLRWHAAGKRRQGSEEEEEERAGGGLEGKRKEKGWYAQLRTGAHLACSPSLKICKQVSKSHVADETVDRDVLDENPCTFYLEVEACGCVDQGARPSLYLTLLMLEPLTSPRSLRRGCQPAEFLPGFSSVSPLIVLISSVSERYCEGDHSSGSPHMRSQNKSRGLPAIGT